MSVKPLWILLVFVVALLVAAALGAPGTTDAPDEMQFRAVNGSDATGFDYTPIESPPGAGSNKGVYTTDYNGDNWTDILAVGGDSPVLFENTGGAFERSEALPEIGFRIKYALFFDGDNDGDDDLLILPASGTPLYLENTNRGFEKRPSKFRTTLTKPTAATAADFDGDGSLEVFIAQHGNWNENAPSGYSGPVEDDNGNPNLLFDNTDGAYEAVSGTGITGRHWSFAVSAVDLNGDGNPDIHVANDFYYDKVYINNGNGTFQGTLLNATDRNGMSSEIADVNNDMKPDIFVTNIFLPYKEVEDKTKPEYQGYRRRFKPIQDKLKKGNNLLINDGNSSFSNESKTYGVKEGGWGWAATFTDFDNDGDEDLLHTTSIVLRINDSDPHYSYPMVWERGAEGFTSKDASELGFSETRGRGAATLDFDRDGDMDVAIATVEDEYRLYENENEVGNSVQIRFTTGETNRSITGTEVYVTVDERRQYWSLNSKADYLSQDTRSAHFGLGETRSVDRVRIVWPDGNETVLEDVGANRRYIVAPDGIIDVSEFSDTN